MDLKVQYLSLPGMVRVRGALCSVALFVRMGAPLLLLICLAGCNNQYTMDLTVPVYSHTVSRLPSAFTPGMPIPDAYSIEPVLVCSIPNEDTMWAKVREKLGDLLGGYVEQHYNIDKLELLESKLMATAGTFESLTYVKLDFKPAPVDGVEQPVFALGFASSDQGLGTEIDLTPPVPVDLVPIMEASQANDGSNCPIVEAEVHGAVPQLPVSAEVTVSVRATVTASGVLASFAGWVLQLFL